MEQILNEDLSKPSFAECLKSGVMLCRYARPAHHNRPRHCNLHVDSAQAAEHHQAGVGDEQDSSHQDQVSPNGVSL